MKLVKKLLSVVLMAALLLAVAAPALAEVVVPNKVTVYMACNDGSIGSNGKTDITGFEPTTQIKSIKSSNQKVVKISSVTRTDMTLEMLEYGMSSTISAATIEYKLLKAGTAIISMKIDGTTCKSKVIVKKYANPIKSLVLTGIGSKNLKTKFAKTSWVSDKLNANAKRGMVKLSAASGWKITDVKWVNNNNGLSTERSFKTPKASVALSIPAMKKSGDYCIIMDFVNTENDATMKAYYWLGNN